MLNSQNRKSRPASLAQSSTEQIADLSQWTYNGFCCLDENSFNFVPIVSPNYIHENDYARSNAFTTVHGERVRLTDAGPFFDPGYQRLPDITDPSSRPFFPIHLCCLPIIDHIIGLKSISHLSGVESIRAFYQILDSLRERLKEEPDSITGKGIVWPHGFYGAKILSYDSPVSLRGWEWLAADPISIPDLTQYILSNLEIVVQAESPLDKRDLESQEANTPDTLTDFELLPRGSRDAALDSLPLELLAKITSYLPCTSILRLHRTNCALASRIPLTQTFWRTQLVSGTLIPFLWDVDGAACHAKEPAECWNWRGLCKTLCTEPFLEVALRESLESWDWGVEERMRDEQVRLWAGLSQGVETGLKGMPPAGLVNRVRVVRVIEDAVIMGRELNGKNPE
jgi:hypothetical protein